MWRARMFQYIEKMNTNGETHLEHPPGQGCNCERRGPRGSDAFRKGCDNPYFSPFQAGQATLKGRSTEEGLWLAKDGTQS